MSKSQRSKRGQSSRRSPAGRPQLIDVSTRQLQAAQHLFREGRHSEGLKLFKEAVRQQPENVRAWVLAARAYAELFRFDEMETLHRDLIALAPSHPGVHHYLGETYNLLKLPERALICFERAASLPGALPATWMELASLYEGAHRLDEAQDWIERTVRAGFDLPLVWLVRGRIARRQGEPVQAEASYRHLIDKTPDGPWACQAWGELALMKDRLGDYAGAIEAIEQCKQIQRQSAEPYRKVAAKTARRMEAATAAITPELVHRWRTETADAESQRLALLTGFPRSGTTLLEQVLDAHPDLVSSEERDFIGKELMRRLTTGHGQKPLIDVLDDLRPAQIEAARRPYLPAMEYLLGEPVGSRMHLDKNPAYNLTLPLVLRTMPEMRLIIALRDPRDVVLSCYLRYLPLNSVSVTFLTPEETARRFVLDMQLWLRLREFIETPWCEVKYEDSVADLEQVARRSLSTLGLDFREEVLAYRDRLGRDKQVTSPTYEAVAQPIYQHAIGRWKHYEQWLGPAWEILDPVLSKLGYAG